MKTSKKPVAKPSRSATPVKKSRAPEAAPVKKKARPVEDAPAKKKARVPEAAPVKKKVAAPVKGSKPAAKPAGKKVAPKAAGQSSGGFSHLPKASDMGLEAIEGKYTRTMIVEEMAETAGISLKEAKDALATFEDILKCHLCGGGAGMFILPGMFKAQVRTKPAVKGGKKAINPFTKEEYITKDKPAVKVLKLLPLKGLKDAVATRR